jgi:arsenate reductase (glutaredoxin)
MKIYHNPRCRKSRETLQRIEAAGVKPEIIKYLETPPTTGELKSILRKLNLTASDLIRKGEKIYKEQFKGKDLSEEEWIQTMVENPKLIERPVVVDGDRAVIGRPPENVDELL